MIEVSMKLKPGNFEGKILKAANQIPLEESLIRRTVIECIAYDINSINDIFYFIVLEDYLTPGTPSKVFSLYKVINTDNGYEYESIKDFLEF